MIHKHNYKYKFLYKTTCLLNNKYYYGVHVTNNLDDGYLGSGHKLQKDIKKYGKKHFKREIIKFHDSIEDMYKHESQIVDIAMVANPQSYNLTTGGYGSSNPSIETREKLRQQAIRQHADPIKKSKWKIELIKGINTSKGKTNRSNAQKRKWMNPEYRSKILSKLRDVWNDPEYQENMRHLGKNPYEDRDSEWYQDWYKKLLKGKEIDTFNSGQSLRNIERYKDPVARNKIGEINKISNMNPVRCLNTNEVFSSLGDVHRQMGLNYSSLKIYFRNNKPYKGYSFERISKDEYWKTKGVQ